MPVPLERVREGIFEAVGRDLPSSSTSCELVADDIESIDSACLGLESLYLWPSSPDAVRW